MDRTTGAKSAIIALLLVLSGAFAANANSWYRTTDFFCLYQGSRALLVSADPYDEGWWHGVTDVQFVMPLQRGAVAPPPCPGRYGYPLWTAVALLPLGLFPIEVASTLWATLLIASAVLGAAVSWRAVGGPRRLAATYGVLVVASQPLWVLLISGQISGIEFALAATVALALTRARSRVAGIALAGLALKPQVAALAILAVWVHSVRARRWSLAVPAAVTGGAMLLVPMLFVPRWPLEWTDELFTRRLRVAGALPTAWGVASDVLGNAAFGAVLCLILVAIVWLIVHDRHLTSLDMLVLSLPLSLFVAPYAWSYDHVVLAVAWAFLLARAPRSGPGRVVALLGVVALAALLPWTLYALAFARSTETLSAVIPALTAIAVAWAIRVHVPAPEPGSVAAPEALVGPTRDAAGSATTANAAFIGDERV